MTYSDAFISENFGKLVSISHKKITAGSYIELSIVIKIGTYGIDDGGHLKVAWPVSNSFGIPQFENPTEDNYTTVIHTGEAKCEAKYESNGYIRPFMPCITLKIYDGFLKYGDELTIIFGDQSQGSNGYKSQTYVESDIEFKLLFDPFGTNYYQRLPDSPLISIISGEKEKLSIIAKSQTMKSTPSWFIVRAQDKFGNTDYNYRGGVKVWKSDQRIKDLTFTAENRGVVRFDDTQFETSGIHFITIEDENGNRYISNPIEVLETKQEAMLFFGDLHGQTGETVGSGTIEQYFEFGLNEAGIDFISHAANAFQVTKEIWNTLTETVKRYNIPGRLVSYLGYEWSGNPGAGGDHNVYYLNDDEPIHRCSHALVDDLSDLDTDRYPVSELYNEFKGRDDVLIIPHIGGRKASLDVIDEKLTPFIEIVSVHGHFDWFLKEAIDRTLNVGFIGSSDTHSCRPGDSFPVSKIEAVKNGLTAVYAKQLTRNSLWEAFQKRNVYATTGARIIIEFRANGRNMGDIISHSDKIQFTGKIIGTSSLKNVDLYHNHELINSFVLEDHELDSNKLCMRWTGARVKTRRRNLDWSGSISIENGKIKSVTPIAFDLPHEGIIEETETSINFISTTVGDYDGIFIEFEGNGQTKFAINTNQFKGELDLKDLKNGFSKILGDVEVKFEAFFMPKMEKSKIIRFEHELIHTSNDFSAYYLRIEQYDGEKAWTSPIFVSKN